MNRHMDQDFGYSTALVRWTVKDVRFCSTRPRYPLLQADRLGHARTSTYELPSRILLAGVLPCMIV